MSAQITDSLELDLKAAVVVHDCQSPDCVIVLLEFALAHQKTQ